MSKYVIDENTLTGIGDAVRAKSGTSDKILVSELATAITNIPAGGGGDLPEELLNITGNCKYRFSNNAWNKFIELYCNKIKTYEISNITSMFQDSHKLIEIPFEINMYPGAVAAGDNLFNSCKKLELAPMINDWKVYSAEYLFKNCEQLRNLPEGFGDNWDYSSINSKTSGLKELFENCYSIRRIPNALIKNLWNKGTGSSGYYYYLFSGCYSLDEINGLSVSPASFTSNAFTATFSSCARLSNMTFQTNEDGTPKTAKWKSQTINLSSAIGWGYTVNFINDYNSGITEDKQVKDDATYQALKDDPDWWTRDINYSRYNHDSAVRTINSLPDCSATGTNTIKFSGASGALTDGGAINTLTEAEIAVAAAKGWTVTLS